MSVFMGDASPLTRMFAWRRQRVTAVTEAPACDSLPPGGDGGREQKTQQQQQQPPQKGDESGGEGDRRGGTAAVPHITWGRANTQDEAYFEEAPGGTNLTALVGQKVVLTCVVKNLGKHVVSWIRRRDLHVLTVGVYTFTNDDRFQALHAEESDQWSLVINPVTLRDAGVYECQASVKDKKYLLYNLAVEVQQARIEGPTEVYVQKGSTIRLTCRVNTHSDHVGGVTWFRDAHALDYDSPRGGVSVEIEKTPSYTTSKLFITRATKEDVGNYTCMPHFADSASVQVHVVNGEEPAAVHTSGSSTVHNGSLGAGVPGVLVSRATTPGEGLHCCCHSYLLDLLLPLLRHSVFLYLILAEFTFLLVFSVFFFLLLLVIVIILILLFVIVGLFFTYSYCFFVSSLLVLLFLFYLVFP
ncbi:palladin-like isoform X2 [Scylla paramamosain]|uniref:palladin-like isoform X2 n=1 Tax=Scylla paramamosain TaxID=85552 RepID=UPI003082D4EC